MAPVPEEVKTDIVTKVKGLLCHKLGKMLVTGSDSIVITGILGLGVMNLYTNYHLIIGGITALLNRIFETLTNSVGNFLLDSNREETGRYTGRSTLSISGASAAWQWECTPCCSRW